MAGKSMFTGLAATTHFGRPNFENILQAVRGKHPKVNVISVRERARTCIQYMYMQLANACSVCLAAEHVASL